jgi:hypothetical protein
VVRLAKHTAHGDKKCLNMRGKWKDVNITSDHVKQKALDHITILKIKVKNKGANMQAIKKEIQRR